MSTTEDVVRILKEDGGYKELPKPLRVGWMSCSPNAPSPPF